MKKISIRSIFLIVVTVVVVLLVIFNMRTFIPFSIGVRIFQIPFFLAFAITYGLGVISCIFFKKTFKAK